MATALSKPVAREVLTHYHGPMIVTVAAEGVYYREKGRRRAFLLPHGVAFQRAVQLQVAADKAAKLAAKKAKHAASKAATALG